MAEAVHPAPWLRGAKRALEVSPPVAHAIRSGVAVTAAIWLGKAPGLVENHSSWILITVLMVLLPTSGGAVLKGLMRAVGTLAAFFTAIALFGAFSQSPPLLMAGLFLVQAIAAYGYSGRSYPYAWFVWAFTTAIVIGNSMAGEGLVEVMAFRRASMVGIGLLLVFVAESLLWPARAEPRLRQSLAQRARALASVLRRAIPGSAADDGSDAARKALGTAALAEQLPLVDGARSEIGVSRARVDALARLIMALETLASQARLLSRPDASTSGRRDPDVAAALDELARRVGLALDEIAAALSAARPPSRFAGELEQALLAVEAERSRRIGRAGWSSALEGRMAALTDVVAVLASIEELLLRGEQPAAAADRPRPVFRVDPLRARIALRSGIAVVVALLTPMVLGWPPNATVAPVAFLTATFNRGAGARATVAMLGAVAIAWLLADLALVYFTPHAGRAPLALIGAFVPAAAFAYLGAAQPLLAMLPTFGGLVYFLSVFPAQAPATDVYGPYNMVSYMLAGIAAGSICSRVFWPATAAGLFRERVATQLALCEESLRDAFEHGASGRRERARELVRACAEQSVQLGPLHQQALLEPVENGLDPARRTAILALAVDLADAVAGDRPGGALEMLDRGDERLRRLGEALRRVQAALLASLRTSVDALRGGQARPSSELRTAQREAAELLEQLRADPPALPDGSEAERRQLLVEIDARRKLVARQLAVEEWVSDWLGAGEAEREQ